MDPNPALCSTQGIHQDGVQSPGSATRLPDLIRDQHVLKDDEHRVKVCDGRRQEPCGRIEGQLWRTHLNCSVNVISFVQNLPVTRIVDQLMELRSSKVSDLTYAYLIRMNLIKLFILCRRLMTIDI